MLHIDLKLIQKIFESQLSTHAQAVWVKIKLDTGSAQIFSHIKKLILQFIHEFFIDVQQPSLKFNRDIFIIKFHQIFFFQTFGQVDKMLVVDCFHKMDDKLDMLEVFLGGEEQFFTNLDRCFLINRFSHLSKGIFLIHLQDEFFRHIIE